MTGSAPRLIVVSGLPAAGKSTLARRLAGDLGVVAMTKDWLKQPVMGLASHLPEAERWRIGEANRLVFERAVEAVLDSGLPVIADGNFNWSFDHDGLRALVARRGVDTFEVCLWGDEDVLTRRFVERADPPLDAGLEPLFRRAVSRHRQPVTTGTRVELDTTDFGALEARYPAMLAQVRAFLTAASGGTPR